MKIKLVSHAVLGYPSFDLCRESVAEMARVGVEIIELQIPFSDPEADGPFFTAAQQESVENGTTVEQCFVFAEEVCAAHPEVQFVFMTYYNIVYKYGVREFVERAAKIGVKGFILPDLPVEEADEYVAACHANKVDPIFVFTPTTSDERMRKIATKASGFVYCQARTGVTGTHTKFGPDEEAYIARCRAATDLPLAMGFGIQTKEDVDFLRGKVDIAICCTQAVKALVKDGPSAMGEFLEGLR
jgi:tryptophan synthase alpha chain